MILKRILSLVLALALVAVVFSACVESETEQQQQSTGTQTQENSQQTAPEPEEPVEEPYEPSVLTGEKYEGTYPQDTRIVSFMINNISNGRDSSGAGHDVRPQSGLSEADILIEIMVEGGITRFLALFEDYQNLPEKIGPVRSARDQFFQIVLPFQPLFVHIGESTVQQQMKNTYEYNAMDVDLDLTGHRFTDQAMLNNGTASWEIAFTTNEMVLEAIENGNKDTNRTYTSTFFNFVPYDEPARELTGDANGANSIADKIDIHHSTTYSTYFTYDEAKGKYLMSQFSPNKGVVHDTIDANNNQQLEFENVIVLFTDIHTAPGHEGSGLQYVEYGLGGVGYYFSNGGAEEVQWTKGGPQNVLRILDKFGNNTDIQVNTGKTYLTMVDLSTFENPNTLFTYYNNSAMQQSTDEQATSTP